MSQFDAETRLQTSADGSSGGQVSSSWNIGTNPNGGYLLALAVAALRKQMPRHPDPVSVTVHYLRPGLGDQPCQVNCQLLRSGATLSTGRASLIQQDKLCLEVLAAFADLASNTNSVAAPVSGSTLDSGSGSTSAPNQLAAPPEPSLRPPEIPPPEQCILRSGEEQGVELPIMNRLDIRLHPDEFKAGAAGKPQVTGWMRLLDGRPPDSLALLLFADAFPPSIFGLLGSVGWVPTIELTVHVRRRPAPGWILGQFRTLDLTDGRMIEDGALWDSTGQLVAQSRQLAMLRRKK